MTGPRPVVLVTGASAGFGSAIVGRFVADGARVIAAARRADRLAALVDELGADVHPLELDVRDRDAVDAAVAALPEGLADIDILVNNAGVARGLEPLVDNSPEDWEEMIDTNCKGILHCARAVLPRMIARGQGHVVNIGSIAGSYPYPGGAVYGASKAFVHQLTLSLRSDLHGVGVRVSCIEPGLSGGTEFSNVRFHGDDERAASVYAGTEPLQPDDVAEAVHWVTSLPAHVNVNTVELMPTVQSAGALAVHRESS